MLDKSNSNNKIREHMVYASLDKKQLSKIKEFSSIGMEQFKEYASIRVCFRTELIMLTQAILSRNAAPMTLKIHEFQRLIIMNACGNINSFRSYIEKPSQLWSLSMDSVFD
jgi:hypothetical protein